MLPENRCWTEIDLSALRGNLAWIRHRVGPAVRIMAVVKADAYGHGLKQIAALLMQSGADCFGVANLMEAQSIRSVGKGWPILMLGPCLPGEVNDAVRDGVTPVISTFEEARLFSGAAGRQRRTIPVHVKVDTGMGRLGIEPSRAVALVQHIHSLPHVRCEGICTHYSAAEDSHEFSRRQGDVFEKIIAELREKNLCPPLVHANNSAALLHQPATIYNLVRPGLLIFGIAPAGSRRGSSVLPRKVRPALSFKCRVAFVRQIAKGTPVSYGRTFVARRRMRVAIATAGYGDGYPRAGSNRAQVLIHGKRCRVLGRVTMDQIIVDVSSLPKVSPGDEVVLIGWQKNDEIPATELADWCGTVPWEVLTGITHRVPRVYRGGHAA